MKRHTPLRPGQPSLHRRTPVPRVNAARRKARFAVAYESEARVLFVQGLPCAVCGTVPSECAHLTHTKAAGGVASDTGPLCHDHHTAGPDSLHTLGPDTFERVHGLSLSALAARTAEAWAG